MTVKQTGFEKTKLCKFSILIAEDDPALLEILVMTAKDKGLGVTYTQDGLDAVLKAQTQKFDAILVDMNLPKKKGYDIVNEVRFSGLSQKSLFFVLSGYLTKEVVTNVAGKIEKAFTKPADVEVVMDTILATLEQKANKKAG